MPVYCYPIQCRLVRPHLIVFGHVVISCNSKKGERGGSIEKSEAGEQVSEQIELNRSSRGTLAAGIIGRDGHFISLPDRQIYRKPGHQTNINCHARQGGQGCDVGPVSIYIAN